MKACNIQLRQEVFAADAWKIADWMEDNEIVEYLNEDQNISHSIRQVIQRVNMPILTHLFNRNGSFFIIAEEEESIGFMRLALKGKAAEMVIVIGEKEKWGKGYGKHAILQGLKHAFYDWRTDEVIAKVNLKNARSRRVFSKVGFKATKELPMEMQYSISIEEFLKIN